MSYYKVVFDLSDGYQLLHMELVKDIDSLQIFLNRLDSGGYGVYRDVNNGLVYVFDTNYIPNIISSKRFQHNSMWGKFIEALRIEREKNINKLIE